VNLDHDKQSNPRWPHAQDGQKERARKVALMYRARLRALDRNACDDCDQTAAAFGETWMLDRLPVVNPDQALTTAEAAALVSVHPDTIRKWACAKHPDKPGEPLLPRFKKRGRERTYLAVNVLAAAAAVRRNQHARART
jgi:hypothetical protein